MQRWKCDTFALFTKILYHHNDEIRVANFWHCKAFPDSYNRGKKKVENKRDCGNDERIA